MVISELVGLVIEVEKENYETTIRGCSVDPGIEGFHMINDVLVAGCHTAPKAVVGREVYELFVSGA
jgi:hypothetical protein